MNQRKLKLGIIGCGNIGSLWDEKNFNPDFPKTHIHSALQSDKFELVGICDNNVERLCAAASFWKIPATFENYNDLLDQGLDAVGIATPEKVSRSEIIHSAISHGVKGILCEKPLANSDEELELIQKIVNDSGIKFVINFIRRFDSNLLKIKKIIDEQTLGVVQKVICHYGKGIKNNGSHLLDILDWFFGQPNEVSTLGTVKDPWNKDPTMHGMLTYENDMKVFLTAQSSEFYTVFEIDLFLTKGRIRILNGGREIEVFKVAPDTDFPDYLNLQQHLVFKDGLKRSLPEAYDHLYHVIEDSIPSQSGIDSSYNNSKIIQKLMHQREK